ncbi:MAG: gliding motility-associated C-terminal domain-containing protein [Bacteroidota bacterium]
MCLFSFKTFGQSVGGTTSGAQTYCDTINSGFVSVSGYVGNVVGWQYSINGGTTWINNGNTFTSQSYFNLTKNTCYRVIIQNGSFPPDTSTITCITVYLPAVGGIINGGGSYCGGSGSGNLTLAGYTGNVLSWENSTNGGSTWTTISNTTTTLPYSNITQNTIYRAIVQNGAICMADTSAQAIFIINPLTVSGSLTATGSTTVCYSLNSNTLSISGKVGNVVNWISSIDNGLSWNTISSTSTTLITSGLMTTTWYGAIIKSANCNSDTTAYININVLAQNPVNAGQDIILSQGQTSVLNGTGTGIVVWTPSYGLDNPGILNPVASPSLSTHYTLTITDSNNCMNTDEVMVTVLPLEFNGMISNTFSPNGDGTNDYWYIENIKYYPENEVTIYNIYGNTVFTKKGYNNDWQGTYNGATLPDGTYFYVVKIDSTGSIIKGSLDILGNK